MHPEPPPLVLAALHEADRALYVGLYTDPAVMRHIGPPWCPARAEADFHAALALPVRALGEGMQRRVVRVAGRGVGLLAVDQRAGVVELGLMLHPDWQGRGIGTRVFRAALSALAAPADATLQVQYAASHRAMAALARAYALEAPRPGPTPERVVQRLRANAAAETPGGSDVHVTESAHRRRC